MKKPRIHKKLGQSGIIHWSMIVPIAVIMVVVAVGMRTLTASHAATLATANSATASDPNKMVFEASSDLYTSTKAGLAKIIKPSEVSPAGVLSEGNASIAAVLGQSGRQIFYLSSLGNSGNNLYSIKINGTSNTLISSIPVPANDYISNLAWSNAAQELAVVVENSVDNQSGTSSLYTINAEGGNLTEIFSAGYSISDPVWSPDGTKIAVTAELASPYNQPNLFVLNSTTANQKGSEIPGCSNALPTYGLAWTLNGENIYCTAQNGITEVNATTGASTTILASSSLTGLAINGSSLSPNGQTFLYSTDSTNQSLPSSACTVDLLNLQTDSTHSIDTFTGRQCSAVDWSPSGDSLATSTGAQYNTSYTEIAPPHIVVQKSDGSGAHTVFTGNSLPATQPTYSLVWEDQ